MIIKFILKKVFICIFFVFLLIGILCFLNYGIFFIFIGEENMLLLMGNLRNVNVMCLLNLILFVEEFVNVINNKESIVCGFM